MNAESTVPASLSPRAAVAMLSLQLRAATQEADTAEADANAVDEAEAREQLRVRLEPLIAERHRALEASLAASRADAAEAILAARTEARRMIEEAAAAAEARRAAIAAERAAAVDVVESQVVEVDAIEPEVVAPEVVESIAPDEVFRPSASTETQTVATTQAAAPVHITVGIDAEAFAAAFATVFVNLIEERMGGAQMAFSPRPDMGPYIVTHLAEPKQSFWKNARHLDVALLGLASAIVLLVLAAWLV